jgi:hypothetical protein
MGWAQLASKPPSKLSFLLRCLASLRRFIIGISRAIGETMIVALAAGSGPGIHIQSIRRGRNDDRLHCPHQWR